MEIWANLNKGPAEETDTHTRGYNELPAGTVNYKPLLKRDTHRDRPAEHRAFIYSYIYTGTWLREETACLHVFRIVSLCESTTETAVLLNRRTDGSVKKNCEWVTIRRSVQEGHEWHFIVRQCISSKAVMLQWAQGLCNKRRVSTRECWWPDAVCWEMSGDAEKVQIQRKAIVRSCMIKTNPMIPPGSCVLSDTSHFTPF